MLKRWVLMHVQLTVTLEAWYVIDGSKARFKDDWLTAPYVVAQQYDKNDRWPEGAFQINRINMLIQFDDFAEIEEHINNIKGTEERGGLMYFIGFRGKI